MASWLASELGGSRGSGRSRGSLLLLSAAVVLLVGHSSKVATAQNMLLMPGLSQWASNMGMQNPAMMGMPNWGGLSLGQGFSSFSNPFQFGQFGSGAGLGLFRSDNTDAAAAGDSSTADPLYGQPFADTAAEVEGSGESGSGLGSLLPRQTPLLPVGLGGVAARNNPQRQAKLQELQAALKGDPAIAAVVGPSLLLASSIVLTVSPSLATASTAVGTATALVGNLVAWSKWINNAEIFFLGLRTGAGRRSLLEEGGVNATDADSLAEAAFRSQMLTQLRAANDMMSAWGEQMQRVRGTVAQPAFIDFLRSQAAALETARKALGAVQSHPLGQALDLGSPPLGLFRGSVNDTAGGANIGNGAMAEQIAKAAGNAARAAAGATTGGANIGSGAVAEQMVRAAGNAAAAARNAAKADGAAANVGSGAMAEQIAKAVSNAATVVNAATRNAVNAAING